MSLYLSNGLSSDVIRDHVMSHDNRQLQVAHTWLRCAVQMYTPPACVEHVKQLTKLSHQFIPYVLIAVVMYIGVL